jgi:polyhydroxyalkanoate synthesis regulator phasin
LPGDEAMAVPQGMAGQDVPTGLDKEMRELKERMESLQRQLNSLQKPPKADD